MYPSARPQFQFEFLSQAQRAASPPEPLPVRASRTHHCRLVVVGPQIQIESAQQLVEEALHGKPVQAYPFKVASGPKLREGGVRIHFEADAADRSSVAEVVRALCRDVRLRYVRLEPNCS